MLTVPTVSSTTYGIYHFIQVCELPYRNYNHMQLPAQIFEKHKIIYSKINLYTTVWNFCSLVVHQPQSPVQNLTKHYQLQMNVQNNLPCQYPDTYGTNIHIINFLWHEHILNIFSSWHNHNTSILHKKFCPEAEQNIAS